MLDQLRPEPPLAKRIANLKPSPIREILRVIEQPGMISFAGGLPNANSFPTLSSSIPEKFLQYGPSEGEQDLRQKVSNILATRGLECHRDQVLILSGSQQGIDLVAKLLVDRGALVALEYPTYLAALQVFDLFGASYQRLEHISPQTNMAYVVPTFQNPTGRCYSREERQALAESCDQTGTILFEDDPYSDLVYDKVCRKPVCALLNSSSWIYQGSFSKSFCPGLRLGYMVCSPDLLPYLTRLKQAADLHSNRVSQHLILELLERGDYRKRLRQLCETYSRKRDGFDGQLHALMGDLADWETPAGGLFFWLRLKDHVSCEIDTLFSKAVDRGVAFMPGTPFFPAGDSDGSYLRLNFSHADPGQSEKGISILAELIRSTP